MRYVIGAVCGIGLMLAGLVAFFVSFKAGASTGEVEIQPLTSLSAPSSLTQTLPTSWMGGLTLSQGGESLLLACTDADRDGALTAADRPEFDGLEIALKPDACGDPGRRADWYAGPPSDAALYGCTDGLAPALLVIIGSAGSDLLDPSAGESMGVLRIANDVQARALEAGMATVPILTTSAVFGADPPQRSLELLLAHEIARRLDEMPCLRAVLIGHSHGGATVTAVTAALDDAYDRRVFGVLIDRTTALYDRAETEYPSRIRLLNVYQTNQGWHGAPLPMTNVYNVDQSYERAPVAASDGGGPLAPVGHKTLDDAAGVQRIVSDAVLGWLTR